MPNCELPLRLNRSSQSNPFCTRFTRPGAQPFLFSKGCSVSALLEQLAARNYCGQIVGPHGSGKSTLLATLQHALRAQGRQVIAMELHDGQRRLPQTLSSISGVTNNTQLTIDGYEQLSLWSRLAVQRFCRRQQCGLLVTSHQPVGLPLLFRTEVTTVLAVEVVGRLLQDDRQRFSPDFISACLKAHGGDLRETLFDLYDRYQCGAD